MYKFVFSSICLAVLFRLAQPSALPESGSNSKQDVRNLEKQVAALVANDIAPNQENREIAKQVLVQGIEMVSEVIKSTALSLCPNSENEDQRTKRSLSTELERDILELLMRGDNDDDKPSQTSQEEEAASEDDVQKVVKDLAKAIKGEIDQEFGKSGTPEPSDFIVSQLTKVLESTLQAIVAISSQNCPSSKIDFCATGVGKASNACVQLRSCMLGTNDVTSNICAEARSFCNGAGGIANLKHCKRALCSGTSKSANEKYCR